MTTQWCDSNDLQWLSDINTANLTQWIDEGWVAYVQGPSRYFLYSIDQNNFFETESFSNFFITQDATFFFNTEEL